jgi:hypothetical protein
MKPSKAVHLALVAAMAAPVPASFAADGHDHRHSQGPECCSAKAEMALDARKEIVGADGFEFVGGESGWQLVQHKYEPDWSVTHSYDCPVGIAKDKAAELQGAGDRGGRPGKGFSS